MTDEEIIAMAKESGFHRDSQSFFNNSPELFMKHFARLIANKVREEDAVLIEERAELRCGWDRHGDAAAILARKT